MARFNTPKTQNNKRKTTNFEGDIAYTMDDKMQLYVTASTGTLSANFYEKDGKTSGKRGSRYDPYGYGYGRLSEAEATSRRIKELERLVSKVPADFAMNLAAYVRHDMYMRTAPIVILAILAKQGRLKKEAVPMVIRRADEITELMKAFQFITGKSELKKLPKQLQKGISMAFQKFGRRGETLEQAAYPFRKYNRQGKGAVTFLDVMRLTHPAPLTDVQSMVFKAIKEDSLPTIQTWETRLSAAGPDPEAKRAAWEGWIDDDMTYMAALRNIRNIIQAGVSVKHFNKLVGLLGNSEVAAKAMQFPFRFFSAYRMIQGDPKASYRNNYPGIDQSALARPYNFKGLFDALEVGIKASAPAIPGFDYFKDQSLLIAGDTSGSMQQPITAKSSVELYHIALVLGFVLQNAVPNVTVGMFGDKWVPLRPISNVLAGVMDAYTREGEAGYATHGNKVIDWATKQNIHYDWFMFFSDQQIYGDVIQPLKNGRGHSAFETAFNNYKAKVNPKAKMVLFALAGYETIPIDAVRSDVFVVAGWSDKIFQVLGDIVSGGNDFLSQFDAPIG